MPTSVALKKLLHEKAWERRTPCPNTTAAGSFVVSQDMGVGDPRIYFFITAATIFLYAGEQDAFADLPASGAAGTFAAGACADTHPDGPSSTAQAGSTNILLNTNQTIVRDLRGYKVRLTTGPNAGTDATIASNTVGANAAITFTGVLGSAIGTGDAFTIRSGRLWFLNPSATAPGFSVYDWATNTWTAKTVTGLPTSIAVENRLICTHAGRSGTLSGGNASAGGASTLTDAAKAWGVNALANHQVRITGGTGKGQVRLIASNTATIITTSAVWTTQPDATSVYVVEPNEDAIYLFGNSAVTAYKYSISANTWATIAPGSARGGAPGAGTTADWVYDVSDTAWTSVNTPLNGRYIYAFRGAAGNVLDIYDIVANTWISNQAYGGQAVTFTTGSGSVYNRGRIFISKEATGRFFVFDPLKNDIRGYSTLNYPMGTALAGCKIECLTYIDGATKISFVYFLGHTLTVLFRLLDI